MVGGLLVEIGGRMNEWLLQVYSILVQSCWVNSEYTYGRELLLSSDQSQYFDVEHEFARKICKSTSRASNNSAISGLVCQIYLKAWKLVKLRNVVEYDAYVQTAREIPIIPIHILHRFTFHIETSRRKHKMFSMSRRKLWKYGRRAFHSTSVYTYICCSTVSSNSE